MKKLLLSILTLSTILSIAQNFTITDYSGNIMNSGTYVVHGDELDTDTAKLITKLSSTFSTDKDISITKYNLNKCTDTDNYFCWAICYTDFITDLSPFVAPDKISMTPGAIDSSFSAYHLANGQTGNAKYRYVWKAKGENDSVYVDVEFQISGTCTTTSLNDYLESNVNIYPNPATSILNIENNNSQNFNVQILNILGENVMSQTVTNNNSTLNTSNLKSGIYFVRIIEDNNIMFSKKVTINN